MEVELREGFFLMAHFMNSLKTSLSPPMFVLEAKNSHAHHPGSRRQALTHAVASTWRIFPLLSFIGLSSAALSFPGSLS